MTYEEYCEIIDKSNFYIDSENPYDMKIIESLEKQIPKKPKNRRVRTLYGDSKYHTQMVEEFTCPCCDERIMFRVNIKRCLVCGQAIDWSEEE